MKIRTHYDNLNVGMSATQEEIKRAYRKLCSIHHPDKHPPENKEAQEEIIKVINLAYATLSDGKLRSEHDLWIRKQQQLVIQSQRTPPEVQRARSRYYANTNMYRGEYVKQHAESEIKERDRRRANEAHAKNKQRADIEREKEKERQKEWYNRKPDPFSYRNNEKDKFKYRLFKFNLKLLLLACIAVVLFTVDSSSYIKSLYDTVYLHINGLNATNNETNKTLFNKIDKTIENLKLPILKDLTTQTELTEVKRSGFTLSFKYTTTSLDNEIEVDKDVRRVFGYENFCDNETYPSLSIILNFKVHYSLNDTNKEFTRPLSHFCTVNNA